MANVRLGRHIFGRSWIFGGPVGASGSGPTPGQTTARPGEYAVKVYNSDGTKLAEWGSGVGNNPVLSLSFELLETGCGAFEMKLGELPATASLNYGMRLDIHLFGDVAPWYSGYVTERPVSGTTARPFVFKGYGFFQQLDWVLVNNTYQSTDIAEVARDIIQSIVEPQTQIGYSSSKIAAVGYSVTKLRFDNVSAKDALKQLSEFATGYVYGVDERREFFFRPITTTVNEQARLFVGTHVSEYTPVEDLKDLCNYAVIRGATLDANGSNVLAVVQSAESQSEYGLRKKVLDIPSAVGVADATRWGTSEIDRLKDPKRRATVKGLKLEYPNADGSFNVRRIKPDGKAAITVPPLLLNVNRPARWTDLRGTWEDFAGETWQSLRVLFEYSETQNHEYPITKVKCNIDNNGIIADLTLGDPVRGIDDWLVTAYRNQKNNEYLQALNNVQLKGGSL